MNNFSMDTICAALGLDPLTRGLQILDAPRLARFYFPPLNPDVPALVAQVNDNALAAQCADKLLLLYPPHHLVTRYEPAREKTATMKLETWAKNWATTQGRPYNARAGNIETPSVLFVPPLARPGSFNAFADIVAHLRAPDGCPWDREQTHQSLRKDFLEECYEVLDTLDRQDLPHLREELGDLMLHILLQTQIAQEANEFRLSEVIAEVSEKLVRRHPHVFGDVVVNGTDEIVANWERIKQSEKPKAKSGKKEIRPLPALMRAQEIAKKQKKKYSAKEIERLVARLLRAKKKEQALGEILFALAAYAQEKHLDAETALRQVSE